MSMKKSNDSNTIKQKFQELFEKTDEEQIDHRAQIFSAIFLSEAEKAMDRKNWTRKKLAKEIGTSASYLTQLFRGDRLLNFKNVAKIERALDLEYEITEKSNKKEKKQEFDEYLTELNSAFSNLIAGAISKANKPDYDSNDYQNLTPCNINELIAA